ncbi:RING finger protein 212B [Merluccius polli]|uniref:RING finger protein 212B n=1 Tax=Merluccius polli TaxID=89951 RepID=A0AA47P1K3_MERPO|nr:RING finger protein 212B [Merluccius polli]
MDWLHCNRCFRTKGTRFFVSGCGHIRWVQMFMVSRGTKEDAATFTCGHVLFQMKPQEQVFFKDPVKLIQTRLEHITQIALFQRKQKERMTAYFKHKAAELERSLKEATEQGYRQVCELRRENAELKKPLSQRRVSVEEADARRRSPCPASERCVLPQVSPGQFLTSSAHRISLPVAVTPPVTPAQLDPRAEPEAQGCPSR